MNNMKLPSINPKKPEKPISASSTRSQNLPIKNPTSNLEKNLFSKLQQYDDLHNIKTLKPANITNSYSTEQTLEQEENATLQKFLSHSQLESAKISEKKEEENQIHKPRHSETYSRIRFSEETDDKYINQTSLAQRTNEKPRSILINKQKSSNVVEEKPVFMTMVDNVQPEPDPDEASEDEQVITMTKRSKDRQQTRKTLNNLEDEDLGQVNNLIFQTNSDMSEFYGCITTAKNTISEMTFNAKSLGIAIRPELLDLLDSQYQELLEMQREDDALEEFDLEQMKQQKHRIIPQANKAPIRATSQIPQKKVNNKKKNRNDSVGRK